MDISEELHQIYSEARDIARASGTVFGSAHLLLAMFTEEVGPNQAKTVLEDHGLDEEALLAAIEGQEPEPDDAMATILDKTQLSAEGVDAPFVNSLHLLHAVCQVSTSLAYRAMRKNKVDVSRLRNKVFDYLMRPQPRRFLEKARLQEVPPSPLRPREVRRMTPQALLSVFDEETRAPEPQGREPRAELPPAGPTRRRSSLSEPEREAAAARRVAAWLAETRATEPQRPTLRVVPDPPATPPLAADESEAEGGSRFALDPEEYPLLTSLGRNLCVDAEEGRLDPVIGRGEELEQVLDILQKRRANNPCLLGEPGVGKTAIGEGVAMALVAAAKKGGEVRSVIELNTGALVAGTHLRGAFSERMAGLRKEVAEAGRRVVLFIDEIHTLIGAGAGTGPMDAANDLKAALARGEFPCIGATTAKEFRQHIESDPALERRFQPIVVEEPSQEVARLIIEGVIDRYEAHHGVHYEPACIEQAVRLSARYIPDRRLPDKAINLVDLAGARAARGGQARVTEEDVARVVSKLSGIPMERLVQTDAERLLGLDEFLGARVVGQGSALGRIAAMIQRNSAGFRGRRPIGSVLLLGPTGVGKTETVRVLADFLFQDRDAMTRLDMSEFSEAHSIAKLIGAAPGYVGHEDGGQLTEAVHRRPYQIVLFDELEKANREVLNILLQILEEGTLKDGKGRRVDFSNTVVAMTSNLGAGEFERKRSGRVGFGFASGASEEAAPAGDREAAEKAVRVAAQRGLTPELWNRIEEKLVYHPLSEEDVARIAGLLLKESSDRLYEETGIRYDTEPAVVGHLVEQGGYDVRFGARPMRRTVQRLVEGALSQEILAGRVRKGERVVVEVGADGLVVRRAG